MRISNVALAHDPVHAGMHRAVEDFSRALDARIVSFMNAGAGDGPVGGEAGGRVVRIACGAGPLARGCHRVSAAASRAADAALAGSDLVVVHSLYRAHAPWAAAWARRHGAGYWAVPHGCLDPWGLTQRGLAKRIWLGAVGRKFLATADRIVFSSRRALDKGAAWVPADRACVVRWPVAAAAWGDRGAARRRCREAVGIPDEARVLLFLGRLHRVKRPLETVAAFAAATAGDGAASRAHLILAGMDGDLTAADVAAAVPEACRGRVHVVGRLDGGSVAEALAAADGFVSLSFQENFGYAAAEAVAAGLPVILSPGHDLAHEMPQRSATHGPGGLACGWLLPDDSFAAAAEAIGAWARADGLRLEALGAAGAAWAREELSPERFRDELVSLARGGAGT
jgi:glycosyltransferase involved in cell wall biosynthesis